MNIRAIQDKVILKIDDPETETSGGIIIANVKHEGITQGEVLAVGPGTYDEAKKQFVATTTKVGDQVLINASSGYKFSHQEEEYVTIVESEIVALVAQ
jgi:chaperonin GroES